MSDLKYITGLTLGTAQLGMPYGVTNAVGTLSPQNANAVLDAAWTAGITRIDTAGAYDAAEQRIGDWLKLTGRNPSIISKLSRLTDPDSSGAVEREFATSASFLGVDRMEAYLCHRASDLGYNAVRRSLEKLVEDDRITCFGVSIYSVDQLHAAMAAAPIGIVQLPLSLANARFVHEGAIIAAAERGIKVFVRSVFLQGILLADPDTLPNWLIPLARPLRRFRILATDAGLSVAALSFAGLRTKLLNLSQRFEYSLHRTM
jgi:aryl-alcohol dehydrogenase-like predicted oxidoreductase